MRIGVLETGRPPPELRATWGSYVDMVADLLRLADPTIEVFGVPVMDGADPRAVPQPDAWAYTGSRNSVNDRDEWVLGLLDFTRSQYALGTPLIGICFGHQMLAKALGGEVIQAPQGWGCGLHAYDRAGPDLPAGLGDRFTIPAMHQDQVIRLPEGARRTAESAFCPIAAFEIPGRVIAVQGHPEFPIGYEADLITLRRGQTIPEDVADAALAGMAGRTAHDGPVVGRMFMAFAQRAVAARTEG